MNAVRLFSNMHVRAYSETKYPIPRLVYIIPNLVRLSYALTTVFVFTCRVSDCSLTLGMRSPAPYRPERMSSQILSAICRYMALSFLKSVIFFSVHFKVFQKSVSPHKAEDRHCRCNNDGYDSCGGFFYVVCYCQREYKHYAHADDYTPES